MKKVFAILMIVACFTLAGCGNNAPQEVTTPQPKTETTAPANNSAAGDTLVVYFSRMGNTDFPYDIDAQSSASLVLNNGSLKGNVQLMAEWIADEEGCGTYEILTEDKYPADYNQTTSVAKNEQNENARPALSNHIDNIDSYSTIYIVYPNWWGSMPMIMYTFLETYDMTGKTVIPFSTNEGSGWGSSKSELNTLCSGADIKPGLSMRGSQARETSAKDKVTEWLDGLGE